MKWQTAVANASEIDSSAAHLLDALELVRPFAESRMSPSALGRWLMESGLDGTIADDTVIWLHHLLLPIDRSATPGQRFGLIAQPIGCQGTN